MKKWLYIFLAACVTIGCAAFSSEKQLDLDAFKITIPKDWEYIKHQGIDSFIGTFKLRSSKLSFDCSNAGYASHLIEDEQEYLKSNIWIDPCYFCKPDVIYTNNSPVTIKGVRADEMKKRGITDTNLVKVEGYPQYSTTIQRPDLIQKKRFPKADHIAILVYRNKTTYYPIEIPREIKAHNIRIDSNDKYVYKTIWPKVAGKGMTGIYIYSRNSRFNFQLSGVNLSAADQQSALTAFKTITFKK